MSLIENFEAVRYKINQLIVFERDGGNLIIRMSNIPEIMENHKDPLVVEYLDTAAALGEDVLKTIFASDDVDNLPVEFIEHEIYVELRFKDRGLFETTYGLLDNIFRGTIVLDAIKGNKRAMENMLQELKRHTQ